MRTTNAIKTYMNLVSPIGVVAFFLSIDILSKRTFPFNALKTIARVVSSLPLAEK
jgi:hypothetical protein